MEKWKEEENPSLAPSPSVCIEYAPRACTNGLEDVSYVDISVFTGVAIVGHLHVLQPAYSAAPCQKGHLPYPYKRKLNGAATLIHPLI